MQAPAESFRTQNDAMRTTYLHIGTHKTGTTSIQWALNTRREALGRRGFLYPKAGIPPGGHHGHHNIGWELLGDFSFRAAHGDTDDLLAEIRASDRNVVLSSEVFHMAAHNAARFGSFVARLKAITPRVVIIVYLRAQADYARSLYLELLRHRYQETFETFLHAVICNGIVRYGPYIRLSFCYRDFLALLPSGEGIETAVRFYERRNTGSVVADFLSVLGLGPADLDIGAEPHANPGGSIAEALLAFYRNRRTESPERDLRLFTFLEAAFSGKTADLSPLSRQRVVAAFDASNQLLNARFTNCALASLAMDNPAMTPADLFLEHLFSEATMHLLDQVAASGTAQAALESERDAAIAHRNAALDNRNAILAERGEFANKYASAAAERDAFAEERDAIGQDRDRIIAERDSFVRERDAIGQDRDRIIAERDSFVRERDAIGQDRDRISAERDAFAEERDVAVAERDALVLSRSWRITAPLRSVYARTARLMRRR